MELFRRIVNSLEYYVWDFGIPVNGETIPIVVIMLLGTGLFLTLRLALVQIRRFGHGVAVTTGRYESPDEPGDVSHFQALTTALSATVGIGNIAGVALAIHWGGPGALFWMWVTAVFGMAVKFTEVTLAQHYRTVDPEAEGTREGSVAGGPMYYIERGLGPSWKPMAIFFAVMLGTTAFLTGNGVQANTVADAMFTNFGLPVWITGLVTASLVGAVIVGGIRRIGEVTAILAPAMATIYVVGALIIIFLNFDQILPTFGLIFTEAFNPSAGVAGTGTGAFLMTLMWGVRRGLYSNEAGQGSAPIAHAAAKTDEPVAEGVVALLEPFIDTLVICTMTALVILMTGVWTERVPTTMPLTAGAISFVAEELETGRTYRTGAPDEIPILNGEPAVGSADPVLAWNNIAVAQFFLDQEHSQPFTGVIRPAQGIAVDQAGATHTTLYGPAVRTAAPLTMLAFRRGLAPLGDWGHYIVILAVLLFAVSTSIAWSYYGDRCAKYLFGNRAILPYRLVFTGLHFAGAVAPLAAIWALGDVMLGIVIFPNLIALILLTPIVAQLTRSYFERKPWIAGAERRRRYYEAEERAGRGD